MSCLTRYSALLYVFFRVYVLGILLLFLIVKVFRLCNYEAGSVQGVDYQNCKLKNYASVKDHIFAMQEGRCALCGRQMDKNNYHCHQLLDQSKGGSDRVHNCIG